MTEIAAPAVALLVACDDRRRSLSETVRRLGYAVVFDAPPLRLGPPQLAEVATDLWLLDMEEDSALVDWLLEHSDVPVLLGNDEIPAQRDEDFPRWQRRLLGKLSKLAGAPAGVPQLAPAVAPEPACCVWLLGASLGGPAAVKRFLDLLPDSLPVAFVYAQHIDAGFEHQLPRILGRENGWRILNCEEGARLQPGEVLVAPISRALSFDAGKRICLQEGGWSGAYQPAIGMLLDEVAAAFAPHCGAIIFSGMGEDGVDACGRLRRQGMQVWTQSADSSACATMPEAVQRAGYSCLQGSPEELAMAMRQWLEQERPAPQ
ncbi:chemotaxis protein CheB [Halopseudomonas pertucinogena]|uniref:protein-glutamate methylesterase n=1 Tax=Halopseudomonas pertucinogena TaxID=86175 RepID=A0ABQ2CQP7_9GAMM|nr:chemotaxis protein CheB [Halopseudomonas pertucinogena]GGJ02532.1 protein-glutamate methylesterase [Halopseudomonas pertucinogena]